MADRFTPAPPRTLSPPGLRCTHPAACCSLGPHPGFERFAGDPGELLSCLFLSSPEGPGTKPPPDPGTQNTPGQWLPGHAGESGGRARGFLVPTQDGTSTPLSALA